MLWEGTRCSFPEKKLALLASFLSNLLLSCLEAEPEILREKKGVAVIFQCFIFSFCCLLLELCWRLRQGACVCGGGGG